MDHAPKRACQAPVENRSQSPDAWRLYRAPPHAPGFCIPGVGDPPVRRLPRNGASRKPGTVQLGEIGLAGPATIVPSDQYTTSYEGCRKADQLRVGVEYPPVPKAICQGSNQQADTYYDDAFCGDACLDLGSQRHVLVPSLRDERGVWGWPAPRLASTTWQSQPTASY